MNESRTNQDGRCEALLPPDHKITTGTYRLIFVTGEYFKSQSETAFFPLVEITFNITDATRHHHVPLLLSPFGYSTYRGS
jgi:5-hydroxyisourate hydrolase